FTAGRGWLAVGAPVDHTLEAVQRRFMLQLGAILALALASGLLARLYVYSLIEVWAQRLGAAVERIAKGQPDTKVGYLAGVRELDELSAGIDRMAVQIDKREAELRRLSMVTEQSPESI
ncbi:hypothetical protein RZS08_48820, partial [Arthrospira platensis SPKY1]|nr:hypothetical protein [Arthrospira platensis SPKY1]